MFEIVPLAGAVHEVISPDPDATMPIVVLLFVQEYVVPTRFPVKEGTVMVAPGHTAILLNCVTVGVGLMVTVKLIVGPVHPFFDGVTVTVPVISELVAFAGAVHVSMFPVPDTPKPICVLVLVHE
jgi:hypothetical protein